MILQRKIFVALGLLLAVSSAHAGGRKRSPAPAPNPSALVSPKPAPSQSPAHVGFQCVACDASERVKVAGAELKANEVVKSQCFSDFMLKWGLLWTLDKTPAQVVADIRAASLTVPVHYYWGKCSVVGYRNPGEPDIYFNRCTHNSYDICDTASNATHEWSHVLGYDHPFNKTSWRGRTVPYAINHAFEACCQ